MTVITMPVDAKPACAGPRYRRLVDSAFQQPGGPESHWMRERVCTGCPVRLECLLVGNASGEHGVWGGLNTNERVRAGGRSAHPGGNQYGNLVGVDHG